MQLAEGQCVLTVTHYLRVCVNVRAFLSPFIFHLLNNVTYKHIGPAETNKQTNKQTTQEATRISGPMNRRDSCSINCCCYWECGQGQARRAVSPRVDTTATQLCA